MCSRQCVETSFINIEKIAPYKYDMDLTSSPINQIEISYFKLTKHDAMGI